MSQFANIDIEKRAIVGELDEMNAHTPGILTDTLPVNALWICQEHVK